MQGYSGNTKQGTRVPKTWEVLGFWILEKNSVPRNEASSTSGLWGGRVTDCGEANAAQDTEVWNTGPHLKLPKS